MEIFCYDSRHYIKNIRLAMDKFDVAQNNVVRHAEQHDQNVPSVGVFQAKFGYVRNCDRNDYLDCFRLRPKIDFLAERNLLIHYG